MGEAIEAAKQLCARCPHALAALPASNVAPAWLMPFLRLRAEAGGDAAKAWAALPAVLPPGVAMPPIEGAAVVLLTFGLA